MQAAAQVFFAAAGFAGNAQRDARVQQAQRFGGFNAALFFLRNRGIRGPDENVRPQNNRGAAGRLT
ncbi:hypothetical protein BN129_1172 [Cronobacter sakazakii 701]|nr:hypothetical protein BN129_1172 [Cronobacter sakazakii 701]